MKTIICNIHKDNWMDSHETAHISITSTTGKTISIYKKHMGSKINKEGCDLIWKLVNHPSFQIKLTIDEMNKLLNFSKIAFFA